MAIRSTVGFFLGLPLLSALPLGSVASPLAPCAALPEPEDLCNHASQHWGFVAATSTEHYTVC